MSRDACLELARCLGVDGDAVLELWNERAAIRELDGGQPRADAERDAVEDVRTTYESLASARRLGPRSAAPTVEAAKKRDAAD
ncbi:MAG: hypothetical protein H0T89_18745 [Deltaproteobacteria bacterium]|nr:hypothetical protein [Deltaproteobacteria bacterium]MDQ3298956.1 hypothetical protein [Myxococcota bacterium]